MLERLVRWFTTRLRGTSPGTGEHEGRPPSDTDVRRTFARIARNQAVARALRNGASNVQPLPKRPVATPAQQRPLQA